MKKFLLTILTVAALACLGLFAACGGEEEKPPVTCTEHTFGEWQTVKEPTCKDKGAKKRVCSVCSYEDQDEIPADSAKHVFGEWETVTEATCKDRGRKERVCTVCNEEKQSEEIPVNINNHTAWTEWATEVYATCTQQGLKKHTCLGCGREVSESIPVDPDAHFYGIWQTVTPSNCTEKGTKSRTCTYCGNIDSEELDLDPAVHVMEKISSTPSTCLTHGKEVMECTLCKTREERELPLSSTHSFVSGHGLDKICEDCGQILNESKTLTTNSNVGEVGYGLTLSGDFKIEYTFVNKGGANVDGWHNWTFEVLPAMYIDGKLTVLPANEYMFLRARGNGDNWQYRYVKEHGTHSYTPNIADDGTGNEFAAAMKNADCVAVFERIGSLLKVKVTSISNVEGYGTYEYTAEIPVEYEDLYLEITGESCVLEISKIALKSGSVSPANKTVSGGSELLSGEQSYVNEGARQGNGYSLTLGEGDFDVLYTFVNNSSSGTSMWHNFYMNFYKCFSTRTDDNSVLWAVGAGNEEPTWGYSFTEENWTGVDLAQNAQYGYGYKVSSFDSKMQNAKVTLRVVRNGGVVTLIGIMQANDAAAETIGTVLYRSQGKAYNGKLTVRLMGENCTLNLKSVKLYGGETATDHTWGEWHKVKDAVCQIEGAESRTCSVCGSEQTRPIPATGVHDFKTVDGVEKCVNCGEMLKASANVNCSGNFNELYGYTYSGDFEIEYTFTNRGGDNPNGWHNWTVWVIPAEYAGGNLYTLTPRKNDPANSFVQVRSRAVQGFGGIDLSAEYTPQISDGVNDGEFGAAMKNAVCTANIKRVGNKITVNVTSVSRVSGYEGKTYICKVQYTLAYDHLYVALTGESCALEITSAKYISGKFTPETNTSALTGDLMTADYAFTNSDREGNGYALSLAEGDFDVTYEFVNAGGTGNPDGWHNFYFNFYKGVSEEKGKSNCLWAIAANGEEPTWEYNYIDGNICAGKVLCDKGGNFVNLMTNAKVYLRITRTNGVITVTGSIFTNDAAKSHICSLHFVANGTYNGVITARLMSEQSSVTLNHVYLTKGAKA